MAANDTLKWKPLTIVHAEVTFLVVTCQVSQDLFGFICFLPVFTWLTGAFMPYLLVSLAQVVNLFESISL